MLHYTVTLAPLAHLYHIELSCVPRGTSITLSMPSWTSGSYLIRDYAGRIRGPRADAGILVQINKCRWQLSGLTPNRPCTISWQVFAYSTGIHDAWLDDSRGFINPAAAFLYPEELEDHTVTLRFPGCSYTIHTSLPQTDDNFAADNIQTLLDAPITLIAPGAEHAVLHLVVNNIPHDLVFTGPGSAAFNMDMIERDAQSLLKTILSFWGEAPFTRYVFHIQTGPKLYGGLEHEASCVLQNDTFSLPGRHETTRPKDYTDFLTVFAHEYFHAWLVKYLRPSAFLPYRLQNECHTHDLWVFEGFTSYYENLLPLRAGVISREEFLSLASLRFNRVREREGFFAEPLSNASFNAWTHLYKQTPDSAYSQSSYYGKGAILAFMLDAALRKSGSSLDNVLQTWFREAMTTPSARTLPDGTFFDKILCEAITTRFKHLTETNDRVAWEAEWSAALSTFGLLESSSDDKASVLLLGLHLDGLRVHHAESHGSAYQAGLFSGDEIVAINHIKTDPDTIDKLFSRLRGMTVFVHVFRQQILKMLELNIPHKSATPRPGVLKTDNLNTLGESWLKSSN